MTTVNYPYFYEILRSIKRTYISPSYRLDRLSTNSKQIEKNSIKQINKVKEIIKNFKTDKSSELASSVLSNSL